MVGHRFNVCVCVCVHACAFWPLLNCCLNAVVTPGVAVSTHREYLTFHIMSELLDRHLSCLVSPQGRKKLKSRKSVKVEVNYAATASWQRGPVTTVWCGWEALLMCILTCLLPHHKYIYNLISVKVSVELDLAEEFVLNSSENLDTAEVKEKAMQQRWKHNIWKKKERK